jgi:hypothetical protein
MKHKLYTSLLLFIILFSCKDTTYFSKEDLMWVDIYNENDTLIFQETISLKKDTTIITRKEVYHPVFQPIARDFLIPHTANLFYLNKKYSNIDNREYRLIEMYKDKDNVDAKPWINYLGLSIDVSNYLLEYNFVNLFLTNNYFNQVYIFTKNKHINHRESQDLEPQTLYWDREYGIIKYETFEGKVWERINFE